MMFGTYIVRRYHPWAHVSDADPWIAVRHVTRSPSYCFEPDFGDLVGQNSNAVGSALCSDPHRYICHMHVGANRTCRALTRFQKPEPTKFAMSPTQCPTWIAECKQVRFLSVQIVMQVSHPLSSVFALLLRVFVLAQLCTNGLASCPAVHTDHTCPAAALAKLQKPEPTLLPFPPHPPTKFAMSSNEQT